MYLRIAFIGLFALMLGCSRTQPPYALRPGAGDSHDNPPRPAERVAANDSRIDAKLAAEAASIAGVPDDYAKLQLLTPQPVFLDSNLLALCASYQAVLDVLEHAKQRAGPHAMAAIRVFMNDSAAAAFRNSAKAYPVGALIVKEKQASQSPDDTPDESPAKPFAVAGMIKRKAGYDPSHGDWEYFYIEGAGRLERGRLASCIDCHHKAARSDYVFGDWLQRK